MKVIEAMHCVDGVCTSANIVYGCAATVKSSWSEGNKNQLLRALETVSMHADFLKASALALIAEIEETGKEEGQ